MSIVANKRFYLNSLHFFKKGELFTQANDQKPVGAIVGTSYE